MTQGSTLEGRTGDDTLLAQLAHWPETARAVIEEIDNFPTVPPYSEGPPPSTVAMCDKSALDTFMGGLHSRLDSTNQALSKGKALFDKADEALTTSLQMTKDFRDVAAQELLASSANELQGVVLAEPWLQSFESARASYADTSGLLEAFNGADMMGERSG